MFSIVFPSRGRPESLFRAVTSLAKGSENLVEILVGLDEDDETREEAQSLLAPFPNCRVVTMTRMSCQAAYYNFLAREAKHDFVGIFADDYTVDQENWAELVEQSCACLPNGYGVAYFHDPMYPFFSTYPIISKSKTMALNIGGNFLPVFFPFLFGDTWLNEVGVLSGLILPSKASVTIQQETGHIHKFRDLRLWSELFHETRPFRAEIAVNIIRGAFGEHQIVENLIRTMPERAAAVEDLFRRTSMSEEFFTRMENNGWDGGYVHPQYGEMRSKAAKFLEVAKSKEAA